MNQIEIVKYEPSLKKEWDKFVKNSKNHHFMFYRDYMEYHSDRFKDYSLLFYKKGKLVGLLPANKKDKVLVSHEGLTFGGILSDKKMTTPLMLEIFEELLKFLKKDNFTEFIYKAIPYIYHSLPAEEDRYALFLNNAELYRRDISSAILLGNRIPFKKERREVINKAKRNKLFVEQSFDFENFMELVKYRLKKRHNAKPVHTINEIKYLSSKFPDNIKLFISKSKDKSMLAGLIIYETPTVAHPQYLGLSDEGEKIGAIDIIHDFLINKYYKNKNYYDFGTSNLNEGRFLNEGLIKHKESFGARGVVHDFYRLKIK